MADSNIAITAGAGTSVDTRTIGSEHRQVVVVGDPATNVSVADVRGADPDSNAEGLVVRDPYTTTIVQSLDSSGIRIRNISDGSIVVRSITNTVAVYYDRGEPAVRAYGVQGTTGRPFLMNTDGAIKIYDIADGSIVVRSITNTVAVYFDRGYPAVNIQSTAVIGTAGSSVSGTINTAGGSGANTLVSPESGRNIKVYAFSLTTTAQVHISPRFTNGTSGGSGEFWRVALQAPSQGIAGANLSVTPPGFLFATGVGNTLALFLDSASLVHYAVSYFKESS